MTIGVGDKGRRESIRCRATSSSNEGDKVDATRAEWRMDCSVVDVNDSNGDAVTLGMLVATEAGAGEGGDGTSGEAMRDATFPPAMPWRAPTTFSQACSKTLTRSFNSLFSLSRSFSISLGMGGAGILVVGDDDDDCAARL